MDKGYQNGLIGPEYDANAYALTNKPPAPQGPRRWQDSVPPRKDKNRGENVRDK